MQTEKPKLFSSGYTVLGLFAALAVIGLALTLPFGGVYAVVTLGLLALFILVLCAGFFVVNPNEAKVLQMFGEYKGTCRTSGLRWANPFYQKHSISTRVRNFESSKLKVNDSHGNPIEIAVVVVWQVVDTYEAMFQVDDFKNFVQIQSESALRNLATAYPYAQHQESEISLSSNTPEISDRIRNEIQDRLSKAGVEVIEARISHLAYAPEIANAMLRRQQASAVVAARQMVVEGAVGMVKLALEQLRLQGVVDLDDERKASMVNNLLIVLCSEQNAQPVVNTGSLYS